MIQEPSVVGLRLPEALEALKKAGYEHIRVTDTTLGRGQAWPLVRVIRQSMQGNMSHLVVCRFPDAL